MTTPDPLQPPTAEASDPTIEELQADRAATRERLAASVEELAAKADVKAQAKQAATETAEHVKTTADQALARARNLPPTVYAAIAGVVILTALLLIRRRRGAR